MTPAAPTDHLTLVEAVLAAIAPYVSVQTMPVVTAKVEAAVHDHFHPKATQTRRETSPIAHSTNPQSGHCP